MLAGLLGLIVLRVPVGLAMLVTGGVAYAIVRGVDPLLFHLQTTPFFLASTHSYAVIPLFLLMGQFATQSGMNRTLFTAARAWMGHRRGGLALASVTGAAGFGAICGSSLATAATMGQAAWPEMRRAGYAGSFATATLAAGGTLGILIPPSFVLVIYAILSEQLIGDMFLAALIPGLLAVTGFAIAIRVSVWLRPSIAPLEVRADRHDRRRALAGVWVVAAVFLVVIGGIYIGWFTPVEGASVGAAATFSLALARGMRWKGLMTALLATAETSAMVFLILLGADLFSAGLAFTRLPQELGAWLPGTGAGPWLVVFLMLLFYLAAGCFMDSLSVILLTMPVFLPILLALDLGMTADDTAIWFGILALVVIELGLITPPVGMNVYVIHGLARNVALSDTFRGLVPFIAIELVRIGVLFAIPGLVLWLPRLGS
ncbi:MAG: TRAP transporter large permease [bacterium]|nr:TRAP transporter large permease [bacterium]